MTYLLIYLAIGAILTPVYFWLHARDEGQLLIRDLKWTPLFLLMWWFVGICYFAQTWEDAKFGDRAIWKRKDPSSK